MMRSAFRFSVFFALLVMITCCFSACSGEDGHDDKQGNRPLKEKTGITDLFLSYIDSLSKFPPGGFSETGILPLNRSFIGRLPLTIHQDKKRDDYKSIVIQAYQNKETNGAISAGAILLVPKWITDSLHIDDFIRHFGSIKKEKPMMGNTVRLLPVEISLNNRTSIKLTFNYNEKPGFAQVTAVEILKHR